MELKEFVKNYNDVKTKMSQLKGIAEATAKAVNDMFKTPIKASDLDLKSQIKSALDLAKAQEKATQESLKTSKLRVANELQLLRLKQTQEKATIKSTKEQEKAREESKLHTRLNEDIERALRKRSEMQQEIINNTKEISKEEEISVVNWGRIKEEQEKFNSSINESTKNMDNQNQSANDIYMKIVKQKDLLDELSLKIKAQEKYVKLIEERHGGGTAELSKQQGVLQILKRDYEEQKNALNETRKLAKEVSTSYQELEESTGNLIGKAIELVDVQRNSTESITEQKMLVKELESTYKQLVSKAEELRDTGHEGDLLQNTIEQADELIPLIVKAKDTLKSMNQKTKEVEGGFREIGRTVTSSFGRFGSVVSRAFGTIRKGMNQTKGSLSRMDKSFGSIGARISRELERAFIATPLRKLFETWQQGFSMMLRSSDEFRNAMGQLSGAAMTGIQPLLEVVIPAITRLAQVAAQAASAVAVLINNLMGRSVRASQDAAKAMNDYRNSINGAGRAARGMMSSLDELNTLQQESSGGAGGIESIQPIFEIEDMDTSGIIRFFDNIGYYLAKGINRFMNWIDWSVIQNGAKSIAEWLGRNINDFTRTLDWRLLGITIAEGINTAIIFLYTLINRVDFGDIGRGIASAINGAIENIRWSQMAQTLSRGLRGSLEVMIQSVSNINWRALGESIREFIINIDWWGIVQDVFRLIIASIRAGFDLIKGMTNGFVATLVLLIAGAFIATKIKFALLTLSSKIAAAFATSKIITALSGLTTKIVGAFSLSKIGPAITGVGKKALAALGPKGWAIIGIGAGIGLIAANWDKVTEFASNAWDRVRNIWGSARNWFSERVTGPIRETWSNLRDGIADRARGAWNSVKNAFGNARSWFRTNVYDNIRGVFSNVRNTFSNIGSNMMSGLNRGIEGARNVVGNTARSIANGISSTFSSIFRISSPSRLFMYYGEMLGLGLAIGLEDSYNGIEKVMYGIHDIIEDTMDDIGKIDLPNLISGTNNYLGTKTIIVETEDEYDTLTKYFEIDNREMRIQNELLQEQNRLLVAIASKSTTFEINGRNLLNSVKEAEFEQGTITERGGMANAI